MRKIYLLIFVFSIFLFSCDTEEAGHCPVTATVTAFGDGSCGYLFFKTSTGLNLHPDQDVIQRLDTTIADITLTAGSVVQIGYFRKESFDFRCLALLVDTNPIDIICISQGDNYVAFE